MVKLEIVKEDKASLDGINTTLFHPGDVVDVPTWCADYLLGNGSASLFKPKAPSQVAPEIKEAPVKQEPAEKAPAKKFKRPSKSKAKKD